MSGRPSPNGATRRSRSPSSRTRPSPGPGRISSTGGRPTAPDQVSGHDRRTWPRATPSRRSCAAGGASAAIFPTRSNGRRSSPVFEAARLAPSADNSQTWRFVVVDDPELKNRLARRGLLGRSIRLEVRRAGPDHHPHPGQARFPGQPARPIQNVPFLLIDVGIAGEHIVLQAEELGLATCWIGWFRLPQGPARS